MKYHINNEFVAGPCGAKEEARCPFFGKNGGSNHYETLQEATKNAEKILKEAHPYKTKQRKLSTFNKNREFIQSALDDNNIDKTLPQVSNTSEMIEKWFNGNKEAYRSFKSLVNESGFTPETKESVAELLIKGMNVHSTNSVYELNTDNVDDRFTASDITLLDETPDYVDIESLRNGRVTAFLNKN